MCVSARSQSGLQSASRDSQDALTPVVMGVLSAVGTAALAAVIVVRKWDGEGGTGRAGLGECGMRRYESFYLERMCSGQVIGFGKLQQLS